MSDRKEGRKREDILTDRQRISQSPREGEKAIEKKEGRERIY